MPALPATDQRRLVQLLAMSDSASDGEALNAVRLTHALVKKHGLTITEAIDGIGAAQVQALDLQRLTKLQEAAFERGRQAGLQEAAATALPPIADMQCALAQVTSLAPNERAFVDDMAGKFRLSRKQRGWLLSLYSQYVLP